MNHVDLAPVISRSRVLDTRIDWDAMARDPLPADAVRTLTYMQAVESHTVVYLRELLSTRAVADPAIAAFLATWFYEETAHGRVLARVLAAAGHPVPATTAAPPRLGERLETLGARCLAAVWRDYPVVHMTWGAINELTTLTGYRRLATVAGHAPLAELLGRIMCDESRHFGFYFAQAQRRLAASPGARRLTRWLVERFWDPVGAGVQPIEEMQFLARYLFAGPDGRAAARVVDRTIRRLPGFAGVQLLEAWIDQHAPAAPGAGGAC